MRTRAGSVDAAPQPALPEAVVVRLRELSQRHGLDPLATARLAALLTQLEVDPHAPTTVTAPADAVDRHIADSLSALDLDEVRRARRIADVGTGAGFPGLVLAIALPEASVCLLDSTRRKCEYLERAVAAAGVANAEVRCERAEEWRDGLAAHDLITARAVAPLAVLAEYAAPLLVLGGALVAWKGARESEHEAAAAGAAVQLGLEVGSVRKVRPYQGSQDHYLHVYLKVRETPERFPRRAGMARKRPLVG